MKKILSLIVCLSVVFTFNVLSYGTESKVPDKNVNVYSKEFPNAFIIVENNNDNSISATVFWEEKYVESNGKFFTTSSRLLEKSEVESIGIENFEEGIPSQALLSNATDSRGKLTLTFDASYILTSNGIFIDVNGNANWSGFNFIYSGTNNPAIGDDFLGLCWGGNYSIDNMHCVKTWNTGASGNATCADITPNGGIVYSFLEYGQSADTYAYIKNARLYGTLYKAALTGAGDKTEIALQYVHTYQSLSASIDISFESAPHPEFSVSAVPNQWSLTCFVENIPY